MRQIKNTGDADEAGAGKRQKSDGERPRSAEKIRAAYGRLFLFIGTTTTTHEETTLQPLRPYQSDIIERVLSAVAIHGSTVMQMPTAAGKTRAATEIVRRSTGAVWFMCHRREIIRQTVKAFNRAGIDHGVISPEYPQDYSKRVQIASVQTLINRLDDLSEPDTIVWDECHHIGADSWSEVMARYSSARHIGLTATPERSDGKGLNKWFKSLTLGPSIRPLINDGFLSEFRYFAPSEPDLREAKLRAGDYKPEDIDKAMNTPVVIGDAISEYRKNCDGKRALVFASSVEASEAIVARFNDEGIPAAHVDGDTPTEQRDAYVSALEAGYLKVLSNFAVFTEGFDLPAIDAVILMRPTKSLGLFLQMVGRGLRPAPGKDVVFIFDHAGLWLEHARPDSDWQWSLEGNAAKAQRMRMGGNGPRRCPKCKEVRYERVEACRCGYEFPTGRAAGEFDGVLYEVRGEVPEGCTTIYYYAISKGVDRGSVRAWVRAGLPTRDGYIVIAEAEDWLAANQPKNMPPPLSRPGRFMSKGKFAKSLGVSTKLVESMAKKGLPCACNGWVDTDYAYDWAKQNINSNLLPPRDVVDPSAYVSMSEFARLTGIPQTTIHRWLKKTEAPLASNGWVHVERGKKLIKGMVGRRFHSALDVEQPQDFEMKIRFAERVGLSFKQLNKQISLGLPVTNGGVHIQRGLEWVRDNTSIEIPPEAWPSANDNQEKHQAAA